MLAGRDHARGRDGAGAGDREMRIGVGRQMQARILELEPVGLHRDRLLALQERHDGGERLLHAVALGRGIDAHHVGIRRQRAGAAAQHGAAARHVVELHEAVRDHQRMVIRQAGHAGTQPNVTRALDQGADEDFRRGDGFPAGRCARRSRPRRSRARRATRPAPCRAPCRASGSRRLCGRVREKCRMSAPYGCRSVPSNPP